MERSPGFWSKARTKLSRRDKANPSAHDIEDSSGTQSKKSHSQIQSADQVSDISEQQKQSFTDGNRAPQAQAETDGPVSSLDTESRFELLDSRGLWAVAYENLREKHAPLLEAYEKYLLESQDLPRHSSKGNQAHILDQQEQLQRLARSKLQVLPQARVSLSVGGTKIVVREQLRKAVKLITSSMELIESAISAQPYSALAWAGTMVLLSLMGRTLQQDRDALEGFELITTSLIRCKIIEDDFLGPGNMSKSHSSNEQKLLLSLQTKVVHLYAQIFLYEIRLVQQYSRRAATRYLNDFVHSLGDDSWTERLEILRKATSAINDDYQFFTNHTTVAIDQKIGDLRELIDEMSASQRLRHQDQILQSLRVAKGAPFDSWESENELTCLEGTQTHMLRAIQEWIEDDNGKTIFWLCGMAGTGKSTIARTAASALNSKHSLTGNDKLADGVHLGASFFFNQNNADRSAAKLLFPTLAWNLAERLPDLGPHLMDALENNPSVAEKGLQPQWEDLIFQPLSALGRQILMPIRLLIVLDALDECNDANDLYIQRIIRLLQRFEQIKGIQIRILITSRPEKHIREAFSTLSESCLHSETLKKIAPPTEQEHGKDDITRFLEQTLAKTGAKRGLPQGWPGESKISKLCHKANGLFMYAATACRFLDDEWHAERLVQIFEDSTDGSSPQESLDGLYGRILRLNTSQRPEKEKKILQELFKIIVGSLAALFKPISLTALKMLLPEIYRDKVSLVLNSLHSVLDVSQDESAPIRFVHLSFRDFLMNKERCRDVPEFYIDPSTAHRFLFERCLDAMSILHEDMCELRLPGTLNSEVSAADIEAHLPSHLQYSCHYWTYHLTMLGSSELKAAGLTDNGKVHIFLKKNLLYWVEVMSLLGEWTAATIIIRRLTRALKDWKTSPKTAPPDFALFSFLYYAGLFMRDHQSTIESAPLQIYTSALMFTSPKSDIRLQFSSLIPKWVTKSPRTENLQTSLHRVYEGDVSPVERLTFSRDGEQIASESRNGSISLWSMGRGLETLKLSNPEADFSGCAFSREGLRASGFMDFQEIHIMDYATDKRVTIEGEYYSGLAKILFSPVDANIVALVFPGMLQVWNIAPMKKLFTYELDNHAATTFATFSPNGRRLAVGLDTSSPIVDLIDSSTGHLDARYKNHEHKVLGIAISPKLQIVASACSASTRIWNYITMEEIYVLREANYAQAVEFSPDGQTVALGTTNGTIKFVSANTGRTICKFRATGESITALAFSPDGGYLASGLDNGIIHVWLSQMVAYDPPPMDEADFTSVASFVDGTDHVNAHSHRRAMTYHLSSRLPISILPISDAIEVSPNGRYTSTFQETKGLWVWLSQYGEVVGFFQNGFQLRFSHDSALAAIEFEDEIALFDMALWKKIATIEKRKAGRWTYRFEFDSPSSDSIAAILTPPILSPSHRTRWKKELQLWDFQANKEKAFFKCHRNTPLKFSPDGKLLAFVLRDQLSEVKLWDMASMSERASFAIKISDRQVERLIVAYAPDSTLIMIAIKGLVHIYDTVSGNMRHSLATETPDAELTGIAASPNCGSLASWGFSASTTTTKIRLWNGATGEMTVSTEIKGGPFEFSFSNDGRYLEAKNGRWPIPTSKEPAGTSREEPRDCMFAGSHWMMQGRQRLLCLPPAYRHVQVVVRGGTAAFVHESALVSFEIDLAATPLAAT